MVVYESSITLYNIYSMAAAAAAGEAAAVEEVEIEEDEIVKGNILCSLFRSRRLSSQS